MKLNNISCSNEQNHEVVFARTDTCNAAFMFGQNKERCMTTGLCASDSACKMLALSQEEGNVIIKVFMITGLFVTHIAICFIT